MVVVFIIKILTILVYIRQQNFTEKHFLYATIGNRKYMCARHEWYDQEQESHIHGLDPILDHHHVNSIAELELMGNSNSKIYYLKKMELINLELKFVTK